jgi:pentatricopeptide repeat protein
VVAISACAKGYQWKEVLQLLDAMERQGLEPTLR